MAAWCAMIQVTDHVLTSGPGYFFKNISRPECPASMLRSPHLRLLSMYADRHQIEVRIKSYTENDVDGDHYLKSNNGFS